MLSSTELNFAVSGNFKAPEMFLESESFAATPVQPSGFFETISSEPEAISHFTNVSSVEIVTYCSTSPESPISSVKPVIFENFVPGENFAFNVYLFTVDGVPPETVP